MSASLFLLALAPARGQDKPKLPPLAFPKGEVVAKVACPESAGQSYALYLPSAYTPDREWPILYAFDPRGNGAGVAKLFQAGAERFGYVIASSNTSASDRPDDPNPAALSAMWKDTHARLAVDNFRVYLAGMSGTVRAAIQLAHARPGVVTGILGAGAGWPFERRPDKGDRFVYYGTTAWGDFNYYEVLNLDDPLKALGVAHHFEIFDGGHSWMPAESATRALAWFDLQAMKAGLQTKDPAWVDRQWEEALGRARAFEAAGNLYLAEREYRQAGADYAGLRDAASAAAKADEIAASAEFKAGAEHRRQVEKEEKVYLQEAPSILAAVNPVSGPVPTAQILVALKVNDLRRKAKDQEDFEARWSATRLLNALAGQTGFYLPADFVARKEYEKAIRILSVGIEINPDRDFLYISRAAVYATKGDRKRALSDLSRAADRGCTDTASIEGDPAFASLLGDKEMQEILGRIRAAKGKAGA